MMRQTMRQLTHKIFIRSSFQLDFVIPDKQEQL